VNPLLSPDLPLIERELDKLLATDPTGRVLGMRSPTKRVWPESLERAGRRFRLAWCPSQLEVREQLDEVEAESSLGVVVLTPLDDAALGGDVTARLPRGRLAQSDRWAVLRGMFRVRDVDSRLRSQRWLADLLIDRSPVGGYPPPAGGILDLETAWRALQENILGLPVGRADAAALLEWTLDFAGLDRFASLPEDARRSIADRLSGAGGPGAGLMMSTAGAGRGSNALPIGLVCGVIFAEPEPRPELRDAAVRLEPLVGGVRVTPEAGQGLAIAAQRVLTRLIASDAAAARTAQLRANALLTEVRAEAAAALSPALDLGLEGRMIVAATALSAAALSGNADDAARAWELARQVAAHDRAEDHRARVDRLTMAARLANWITRRPSVRPSNMAEAAAAYAQDGGFADRARHALQAGDALPGVATAYRGIREASTTMREKENHTFAELLRAWNESRARGSDPVPVERLLDFVVAPLAREVPVLFLVFDGLSFAVWRHLAETLPRLGWTEFRPQGRVASPTAVAALPTVTEVSRASLFCGTLTRGDQSTERAGFATHEGLVAASAAGRPPRLFHKADLGPGPELLPDLRDAVADRQQRVIGVVHNAVDAQLSGSDQIELTWSAEGMRQVAALLRVARDAGRVVVVTGDHGHMIEGGTTQHSGGAGDRWRSPGPVRDGEVTLSGGRVISPDGGQTIVAAWSERVRYASRHGGYHGGASPQEVLVPVAVFSDGNSPLPGWVPAPPTEPSWWRGSAAEPLMVISATSELPITLPMTRRRSEDTRQPELFAAAATVPVSEAAKLPPWMARLLVSDIYLAQRRLAGRGAPTNESVLSLLETLSTRGGRISRTGLAQALSMPALRIGGLVNAARRLLNLDQAQVLAHDGDDVVLNERLLREQFGLGQGP
jgi:hypothetical protein